LSWLDSVDIGWLDSVDIDGIVAAEFGAVAVAGDTGAAPRACGRIGDSGTCRRRRARRTKYCIASGTELATGRK